jgi:transposase
MLGIDVSKDTLSCVLLDPSNRRPKWHREIKNTAAGWKQLLGCTEPTVTWVVEPTGRYSQDMVRAARLAGRDVRLAPPKQAQLFLRSVQGRAKTDRLDAKGLALYGLARDLAPYPLKSAMHEEIDQLLLARKGLSQSLSELEARQRDLPRASAALAPAVSALREQLEVINRQIAELTKAPEMEAVQRLLEVHGIGPVTASTAVSCLTSRSFSHSDQFVAYCGLDIRVFQSGRKKGQLGLTKNGDAELRRLFFLAAKSSLRAKGSPFKAQYDRELAKGMSGTAAICSVARKMARLSWSIVKHNSEYDPQRVYQQPQAQTASAE